jgi:putative transposase
LNKPNQELQVDYAQMPNHFHLVLWPRKDGELSDYMMWLLTAHVRRYHQHYHSSGHVWQGRFRAFPIQEDDHLLTVLRYTERNEGELASPRPAA